MADNPRLDDLRRRVQMDPASIAFAQLAEECRRAGLHQEAVDVCRTGLARHPAYVSARVTLGRALIELDQLDDAMAELSLVLESAPDNLAALRGLAVIHRRQGDLDRALACARTALELAPRDPDLERTTADLARQIEVRREEEERRAEEARRAAEAQTPPLVPIVIQTSASSGGNPTFEAVTTPGVTPAGDSLRPSSDDRASRTLAALEQWLAAVHVVRARRRA
jgi:tetratricopeptide (TPR) repeat protein